MREVEFLPGWYAELQQRRRMVILQSWVLVVLVCGLGLWLYMADHNQRDRAATLDILRGQLVQTNTQLAHMERLESLRKQWRQQVDVLNRMGVHVESGRLLGKLAEMLPDSISLLAFSVDVTEVQLPATGAERAGMKEQPTPRYDRRLHIRLQGVAPTDVELATFLTELNRVSFFERVAPTYVKDRRENGHILREFELTFSVNLNSTT